MSKEIIVEKRDGTKEKFQSEKLRESLQEAGAPEEMIQDIVDKITDEVTKETTTNIIYERAFELLKEKRRSFAARYSLRQSLADLGPTGYPFEKFVARIFDAQGYNSSVGVTIQGNCARHEIDVVAESDKKLILVEAKFHNSQSIKSAVQTSLYVNARFNDIEENDYGDFNNEGKKVEYWLVTNTKFSSQAIKYGECSGLQMIGWGYPEEDNLEDLITEASLQPVTALTTLSGSHTKELTKNGVVLCKTLRAERDKLEALGFDEEKIAEVMNEVNHLCHV